MFERIGDATGTALKYAGDLHAKVHYIWGGKYNPDLYSANDAKHFLGKIEDSEYLLGTSKLNPKFNRDRSKIWSMPPEVLDAIKDIVKDAGHVHIAPFVMGTYHMKDQTMRMNDFCLTDPIMLGMMATGHIEGFAMPFLRGLYHVGRPSWWRHESIHARHHHQMAYYLDAIDPATARRGTHWQNSRMEEAMYTIHESGIEELITRWQALKEGKGLREKAVSSLALLFYMEYTPFTGTRNAFIDGKEKTLDLLQDGKIRIPVKIATQLGLMFIPPYLNDQAHAVEGLGEAVSQLLPVTDKQVEGAVWRGHAYVWIAALSALFSSKQKGAFEKKEADGQRLPTKEYKFPYVYNPVTSTTRSIGFMRYLGKTWDQIPNYRQLESPADIDKVKKEIDDRVVTRLDARQHQFTMSVVEDALRPFEGTGRSSFPQEAYIKGMFTPALYVRLRELYH